MDQRTTEAMRDGMDAMTVLAFRLPMLMMTPSAARRRESERMVEEKVKAAWDGAVAWQSYWMTAWLRPFDDHVAASTDAWAAPGRRTLRANARRLGRRRTL